MGNSIFATLLGEKMPTLGGALSSSGPSAATSTLDSLLREKMPSLGSVAQSGMAAISYKDPAWVASEAAASKKTGVPAEVLSAIRLHGERSNGNQVSPKGARGVYQFIESSRNAFLKKYGVDAYSSNPDEQALAAAHHLNEGFKRTGDWGKAMAGFNGGISGERGTNRTQENADYVRRTTDALRATPLKLSDAGQYDQAWSSDQFAADDTQDTDMENQA